MNVRTLARLLAGAALVVTAATACGPASPGGSPDTTGSTVPSADATPGGVPTTTTTPAVPAGERMPGSWRACDNPTAGYSIGYPGDWHTAEGQHRCSMFHPEPFEIPGQGTASRVALNTFQTDVTVATQRDRTMDPTYVTVVRDEEVTLLNRPAVRFETVSTAEDLHLGAGVRRYGYMIDDGGGGMLEVWTIAWPDETRYEDWKSIVDTASNSVRFLD